MGDTLQRGKEIVPQAIEAIDFNELVGIGRAAKLTGPESRRQRQKASINGSGFREDGVND